MLAFVRTCHFGADFCSYAFPISFNAPMHKPHPLNVKITIMKTWDGNLTMSVRTLYRENTVALIKCTISTFMLQYFATGEGDAHINTLRREMVN